MVIVCGFVGLLFAFLGYRQTAKIKVYPQSESEDSNESLMLSEEDGNSGGKSVLRKVSDISAAISEGANAFLYREYTYMAVFMVVFTVVIIVFIGLGDNWASGAFTAIAFNVGAVTSIVSGFIGMRIAVFSNSRTALQARNGFGPAFVTAFRAGTVMGFSLVSIGLLVLYVLLNLFRLYWKNAIGQNAPLTFNSDTPEMYEAIAGYGLGGSTIALFGRVGGGIYTKAADVGADLCGKLEFDIPEDDPRNPAVIADNVGDNVGDIAGMGADLFGSFAEATCAAMVISSQSIDLQQHWSWMCFPLLITATGILVCLVTSFVATHLMVVSQKSEIEPSLKRQILVSTLLMTPVAFVLCYTILPKEFLVSEKSGVKNWHVFFCIAAGLWSGMIIGYVTEYYTSNAYTPVQEVSKACDTGAATNIIYGLALGYKSVIVPVLCLAVTIYVGYSLAGMYGIAMGALGILSTLSIGLTIDAYGPICDNAGGIAEMAGMGKHIRDITDALDAAGNTTAAIGKGFAIGSAALVSLALFGAFVTVVKLKTVDILQPFQFAGLLVGSMLPYWFSALTMKSVGKAALAMVEEVRRQFTTYPKILEGTQDPSYSQCVDISTAASLREMIPPGALVILSPLVVGYLFGVEALAGLLAGALVSGVQIAISAANTGGAWDNAKKYIESRDGGKGSDAHRAAVVGDTVGDPLKDTSGPSLNILIKLMAIISLVFARSFPSTEKGGYIVQLFHV
jgi:inorganic pyrophosphatase